METREGTIKRVGSVEKTRNGRDVARLIIAIGKDKVFDRRTGQPIESDEEVSLTLWDGNALEASKNYSVGDLVKLSVTHYVDQQYGTTVCLTSNIEVVAKCETRASLSTPTQEEANLMKLGYSYEQAHEMAKIKPSAPEHCPV